MDNVDDIYNVDEEQEIANIVFDKEVKRALDQGLSLEEAQQKAQKKQDEARRNYALNFLKRIEKKLNELSNQEIANILRALIASGLPIESEEELEYWINQLERESLHRIAFYFYKRNKNLKKGSIFAMSDNVRAKVMKNVEAYTSTDIEAMASMMTSVNKIFYKKMPKDKRGAAYEKFLEREKFFKKVEAMLQQDARDKKAFEKERRNHRINSRQEDSNEPNYLEKMKEKMRSEKVIEGGEYWNSVIEDFNTAQDKKDFVDLWQKDNLKELALDYPEKEVQEKINKLRGLEDLKEKEKEESGKEKEKTQSKNNQSTQQNVSAQQIAQAQAQANASSGAGM